MADDFERNEFPLAYLITIRTLGTWLHGNEQLSVDRHGWNVYGTPRRPANAKLKSKMLSKLNQPAFFLTNPQRETVKQAIDEVCNHRLLSLGGKCSPQSPTRSCFSAIKT